MGASDTGASAAMVEPTPPDTHAGSTLFGATRWEEYKLASAGGGGKVAKTAAAAYTAAQYKVAGGSLPQDALWNEAPPNTKGASNTQPWAAHAKDSAGDCRSHVNTNNRVNNKKYFRRNQCMP